LGKSHPIGLFDSGVGGLTVAHALHTLLPSERLIYFGDTAHLPYGDKSRETIVQYSLGIADFLLEQKCKLILIACNTASANAFEEVSAHVGERAVVMNVIDPVVDFVCAQPERSGTIGIIGTKATIDSGTYEKKIMEQTARKAEAEKKTALSQGRENDPKDAHRPDGQPLIQVNSLATPLFVPMIEEGFVFDDISNAIIRSYLSRKELQGIDSLSHHQEPDQPFFQFRGECARYGPDRGTGCPSIPHGQRPAQQRSPGRKPVLRLRLHPLFRGDRQHVLQRKDRAGEAEHLEIGSFTTSFRSFHILIPTTTMSSICS
jgi:glutamate racemase